MSKKVNCIMLVDDNPDDNFFHERVIRKNNAADHVVVKQSARAALEYLQTKDQHKDLHPDLIFLDINMPGMNGWDFMEAYFELDKELQGRAVIMMLTSSDDPDDKKRAEQFGVALGFKTKPLTKEMLEEIMGSFF